MLIFTLILALIALGWIALALNPVFRHAFVNPLNINTPVSEPSALPPVFIIVPARNEESMLPDTLPTLCNQDYPNLRVILIDDQSDDATPRILADLQKSHPNLHVIQGTSRPAGWYGKPWAVSQGVAHAQRLIADLPPATPDPLFLFTDADILFHPRAVRIAVSFLLSNDLEMLSLFPQIIFGSTVERVGMAGLVSVLNLVFPTARANDPKSPVALAAGGFLLIRRPAYHKVGGHEAVKGMMIEDVNLAKMLKALGVRVHCRLTPDLVRTRMYEGFADLWEGLSKNAYAGMEYQPHKFWAGLAFALVFVVLPPLYLALTLLFAWRHPTPLAYTAASLAALAVLAQSILHGRTTRHLRLPAYHAFFMPLSAGLYGLIALHSFYQHHFAGGTVWKGRKYAAETPAPNQAPPPA